MNIMDPREMNRMLQEQWFREENMINEQRRMMEFQNEVAWREAQQHTEKQEIQERMNQYTDEFIKLQEEENFQDAYEQAEAEYEFQKNQNVNEQEVIKDAANDMLQVMQADPDPKFQQSKFLDFLKKIESGAFKIENNQLIKNEGEQNSEFQEFENAWQAEEEKIETRIFIF
jgi:peroxin-5